MEGKRDRKGKSKRTYNRLGKGLRIDCNRNSASLWRSHDGAVQELANTEGTSRVHFL